MKTVNDYFGLTDSDRIEAAMRDLENGTLYITKRKCETEPERDWWSIDRAILIPENTTVVVSDCKIKLSDACRDNFFRSANCGPGIDPVKKIQNIHIRGEGYAVLEGADHPRATGDGSKVLANPCPKKPEDLIRLADWIPEDRKKSGKLDFWDEHAYSFGTDVDKPDERHMGDWRGIGVLFARAENFSIENLHIICSHGWGVSLEECAYGRVEKMDFDACMAKEIDGMLMNMENQDGIDLRNGCHDIVVSDITGGTGDDLIALTAIADDEAPIRLDGAMTSTHILSNDWSVRDRSIHDIIIRNVVGYSKGHICFHIRLLPAGSYIWNVVIDGVIDNSPEGFRAGGVLLLGDGDGYGTNLRDSMRNISISNVICDSSRAIIVEGYLCDSVITNVINRNPDCPVIDVCRPDGMKNVVTSGLCSAGNMVIRERK